MRPLSPLAGLALGGGASGLAGALAGVPAAPLPTTPLASAATIVGSLGLSQRGSSLIATSADPTNDNHALWTLPAGIVAAGPWAITLVGSYQGGPSQFPTFGINLSTAATQGTAALFCGSYTVSDQLAVGAWTVDLHTQTRPSISFNSNTFTLHTAPQYLRLLNDGTNFLCQWSNTYGIKWRSFFNDTIAHLYAGTPTVYGISCGAVSGSAFTEAVVSGLAMTALPTPQISLDALTLSGSTWTAHCTANHGMQTGDGITLTGITYTGTAATPNGLYDGSVVVTGPASFTVPLSGASGTFTLVSAVNAVTVISN